MNYRKSLPLYRLIVSMLIVSTICTFNGCATLAHRTSPSIQSEQRLLYCDGRGDVCPWLWGDAGLLLLGIVPGVLAFGVDFGTGAWRHLDDDQFETQFEHDNRVEVMTMR